MISVHAMHSLSRFAVRFRCSEHVHHVNPFDDQHAVFGFFHFSGHFGSQSSIVGFDCAHFQCAAKCADQSTGHRSHEVIDCGCVRLGDVGGLNPVMGGNGSVNAESYRIGFASQVGITQRALPSFDLRFRHIR